MSTALKPMFESLEGLFNSCEIDYTLLNPDCSLARHSGEGRNPARKMATRSGQSCEVDPHSREIIINWIPAFAGMTQICSNELFGLKNQTLNEAWLKGYSNQRIVNSFLFNYIKIQDKLGASLFRKLLFSLREISLDHPKTFKHQLNPRK